MNVRALCRIPLNMVNNVCEYRISERNVINKK